jgi:hypothetical protein
VFEKLCQDKKNENHKKSEFPLIESLEFAIKLLYKDNSSKEVEIFYLIGITRYGLVYEDLISIFEAINESKEKVDGYIAKLLELALI